MTTAAEAAGRRTGEFGMGVTALLALAVFINYVDRGNLATAAPLIQDELKLSSTQMGWLLSAFFWVYTPAMLLAGWLSEKINPYRTLTIGLTIWAVATMACGVVGSFVVLFAFRLLLGLGEAAFFPCSSKILAQNLPQHRLGAANGLIGVGLALGPAFGTFAGGEIMAHTGWRMTFLLFGAVSLMWLLPWLASTRHISARADLSAAEEAAGAPSFWAIVRRREAWGASLGHFFANYAFYFVISWLPTYLVKARGFSVSQMAQVGGLIYLVYAASCLTTGWAFDRWMARGASANLARKTAIIIGHAGAAIAMVGCAFGPGWLCIASLFLAGAAFGFGTPTIFSIAQTLAGPNAAGKWVGIQNAVGNIPGILAPIVTGMIVDKTGQFFWAFVVAGVMASSGIIAWGVVIRKVEPVRWEAAAP